MGLSDLTGEILGIPEPSARFLLALYGGELLVIAYTWTVATPTLSTYNIIPEY